ncbi:hypothetical protein DPMN_097378 [Dreissena polymorpha]|uniref:Kazal-like domain-containing protein n=1 Tax=Dreissena polymorpha TaxID=45954 RepID=A0A9D4LA65_DREPO|nr:hypothetical protein DPMN_097378 [Dreissena polymorpha]
MYQEISPLIDVGPGQIVFGPYRCRVVYVKVRDALSRQYVWALCRLHVTVVFVRVGPCGQSDGNRDDEFNVREKRKCNRSNLYVLNQQGLHICPREFIWKRKRTRRFDKTKDEPVEICCTNGVTYPSRCHLKIANCNSTRRIKREHDGVCTADDVTDLNWENNEEEIKPINNAINDLNTNYVDNQLHKEGQKRLRGGKRKEQAKKTHEWQIKQKQ